MTCKIVACALATGLVLAASGCGTDCQLLVAEYINGEAYAKSCDPTAAAPCSVQLPVSVSMYNSENSSTPVGFASNCDTSYNPAHSAYLQSLVSQAQSSGCKFGDVPLCNDASTAQCVVLPADQGGDGGYTCVDGPGVL